MFFRGIIACLLAIFIMSHAYAEDKSPSKEETKTNVSLQTVLENLKINGYEIIKSINLDDKAVFTIEALTPQGQVVSVKMNAQTGEILSPKTNPTPQVNLAEAIKRVEGSGYHDISSIEYSGEAYTVRAKNDKDKKVKLKLNGQTGEIKIPWF